MLQLQTSLITNCQHKRTWDEPEYWLQQELKFRRILVHELVTVEVDEHGYYAGKHYPVDKS
jgi:hypothetical protein